MFHFCDERLVNRMSDASILQVAVSLFGLMQILFIQKSIDPKQYVICPIRFFAWVSHVYLTEVNFFLFRLVSTALFVDKGEIDANFLSSSWIVAMPVWRRQIGVEWMRYL